MQNRNSNSDLSGRLAAYATAAGATVVAGSAQAAIIYTDVVPDRVLDRTFQTPPNHLFDIDFNSDSVVDVRVGNVLSYGVNFFSFAGPLGSARVVNDPFNIIGNYAAVLTAGTSIGPLTPNMGMSTYGNLAYSPNNVGAHGPWVSAGGSVGTTDGYEGVRFTVAGQNYYGWIRMDVANVAGRLAVTVKDFAYESTPNTAILAGDTGPIPEPASLGVMALGSVGLMLRRRA